MSVKKETFWTKYFNVKIIAANGIVAALYVVLTLVSAPLAYEFMQVRIAEFLNLLVFFNPAYTLGLTLGCLIANLFSTVGPLDILIGTATTLIACILMSLWAKFVKNLFFAGFIPVLANAAIVPLIIYLSAMGTESPILLDAKTYFIMFGWVALGEFAAIIVLGYPLMMILTKRVKKFNDMILATRNREFKW